MSRMRRFAYLAPFLATITTHGNAQDVSSAGELKQQAESSSGVGNALEEVIVTAQQRSETLQEAALPISAVTGADLQRSGITGLDSLGKNVPSIQIQNSGSGNLIFIRGVGSFSFQPASDPAAAFNYDGVYVGRSASTVGAFFDLERVEVLKGPQGTLYGRNATAGAINVLPAQPRYDEFSGYATASYGNYDALVAEGAVNIPLGDRAALRVSGFGTEHDGYLADGTSSERSWAGRSQLKVELNPNLTVRLSADYAHVGGTAAGTSYLGRFGFNPATLGFTFTPSGIPVSQGMYTPESQAFRQTGAAGSIPGRTLDPQTIRPYIDNNIHGVQAQIDWSTPIGTVTIIPAWRHGEKEQLGTNISHAVFNNSESDQTSIEARLVSDPGRSFDYIIGSYYFDETIDDASAAAGATLNAFPIQRVETRSPSAYGRLTFHASDVLRFVGGVRYTRDSKDYSYNLRQLALLCLIPAAAGGCPNVALLPYASRFENQPIIPPASGAVVPVANGGAILRADSTGTDTIRASKVTWRGAVEFDATPESLLYASVETGYRAGGFNTGETYAPESITAYTVGSKNRFFDNTLQLNLEGFVWKYRDQQLSFLGINSQGAPGPITRNIGKSTSQGLEIEAIGLVTDTTQLMAGIQYLDATYDEFTYVTPAPPYTGCAVTPEGGQFSVDCADKPLFNAPEWTLNLGAQQRFSLGDAFELAVDVDTQYRSSRYTSFEFVPPELQESTWISNAQISLIARDGAWSLSAFVRNIEDERYQIYATPVAASNLVTSIDSNPRTYGVRVSVRF